MSLGSAFAADCQDHLLEPVQVPRACAPDKMVFLSSCER